MVIRVERATGPLRRAPRPPLCVRLATTWWLERSPAEARRQVAAENGRVARSIQIHALPSAACLHPLL